MRKSALLLCLLIPMLFGCGKTNSMNKLTLQQLEEYTIVYSNQNGMDEVLANWLANRINTSTGYTIEVVDDLSKTEGKEILVGNTNRTKCSYTTQTLNEGEYIIGADKHYICARGNDSVGNYYAVHDLIQDIFGSVNEEKEITFDSTVKSIPPDSSLSAMSFNVYVKTPTPQRQTSVLQTILNSLPDTMGVQEASISWMDYLNGNLGELYASVGQGRDGGVDGEYSAIFYRKDRFELIEEGTKWLSDTPDSVSRFSESSYNRIFTYAILLDKQSNSKVMVVNTHLEHSSSEARNKQIAVLLDCIKNYTEYPIILTGDFNSTPDTAVYQLVTEQFADSSEIANKAETSQTFHKYGEASRTLDYIFVSRDTIDVSYYKVVTEAENGILPSDHYPVYVEYKFIDR